MPGGPGIRDFGAWPLGSLRLSPLSNLPGPAASAPGRVCRRRRARGTVALTRLSRQPAPAMKKAAEGHAANGRNGSAYIIQPLQRPFRITVSRLWMNWVECRLGCSQSIKMLSKKNRSASLPSRAASPDADVALFKHRVSSRTPCASD
jgi:hypothetical protein